MPDYTDDDLNQVKGDGKASKADIKAVPGASAPPDKRRAWLTLALSAEGIGEIVRWGGSSVTAMTVEVFNELHERRIIRFEHEDDATRHGTLRAEMIRQGGVRAEYITSAKIAGDAYFLLCSLARIEGGADALGEIQEVITGYRLEAKREPGSLAKVDLHGTLNRIRSYPYSRRLLHLWQNKVERRGEVEAGDPPKPPLIVDSQGGEWTSITHLACYMRWGRDIAGTINPKTLGGLVVEAGGERRTMHAWNGTTRDRTDKITTVLIRFPEESEGGV